MWQYEETFFFNFRTFIWNIIFLLQTFSFVIKYRRFCVEAEFFFCNNISSCISNGLVKSGKPSHWIFPVCEKAFRNLQFLWLLLFLYRPLFGCVQLCNVFPGGYNASTPTIIGEWDVVSSEIKDLTLNLNIYKWYISNTNINHELGCVKTNIWL